MKVVKSYLLFLLLPFAVNQFLCAQDVTKNLGFEQGNFNGWKGYTWTYSTNNTEPIEGFVDGRHLIITESYLDTNTGNLLKTIRDGYTFSARLGQPKVRAETNTAPWNENQSLRYTMTVDKNSTLLLLKFALVLQFASDHNYDNEPRFCLTVYNKNGDTIPDCANWDVYASNTNDHDFQINNYTYNGIPVQWRDWKTVGVDLSKYIDSTITIEFRTADCTLGRHFGYAYFVADCQPMEIKMKYCTNDQYAQLTAPDGFEKYEWTDGYGNHIDTIREVFIENPTENSVYQCKMVSATGCEVSVQTTISKYTVAANFGSKMIDCISNIVRIYDSSFCSRGAKKYYWKFDDSENPADSISTQTNPSHQFDSSGIHTVKLRVWSTESGCVDTLTKTVESFFPPMIGPQRDTTYCPGLTVTLKAYGAFEYVWYNSTFSDSVNGKHYIIGVPGGKIWLIGRSSTGCADTNEVNVSEEPDWDFLTTGDSVLCLGDTIPLSVSGGVGYLWSTGDTNNSILISQKGDYSCVGWNLRGCKKSNLFPINQFPLPNAEFSPDPPTLSEKNTVITCNQDLIEDDVLYSWDFGDSTSATGSSPQHRFDISNGMLGYTITLKATDKYNCVNTTSENIDVIPFIPNVFSPNGDNVNQLFMPRIDLTVFDRNGTKIYSGTDGWDGTFHGKQVDQDTYFYSIYYYDRYNQKHNKKGFVTVVR
jgi:gliding motility-associated-like protein